MMTFSCAVIRWTFSGVRSTDVDQTVSHRIRWTATHVSGDAELRARSRARCRREQRKRSPDACNGTSMSGPPTSKQTAPQRTSDRTGTCVAGLGRPGVCERAGPSPFDCYSGSGGLAYCHLMMRKPALTTKKSSAQQLPEAANVVTLRPGRAAKLRSEMKWAADVMAAGV